MTENDKSGALVIPIAAPNAACATAIRERLRGHATSDSWLPADSGWPVLEKAREEHLRVRSSIVVELEELEALEAGWRAEDKEFEQKLRQAVRGGRKPASVKDSRTAPERRESLRSVVADRIWAGVLVLADVVDEIVGLFRENEDEWLAELRQQRAEAREKLRQLEAALVEARTDEWQKSKLGKYIKVTADNDHTGMQPAPVPEDRPKMVSDRLADSMLERPYYEERENEKPMRAWQESQTPQTEDEPLPTADPTGVVSALDESVSGARR